jgi:hypothetical protein
MRSAGRNGEKPTGKSHSLQIAVKLHTLAVTNCCKLHTLAVTMRCKDMHIEARQDTFADRKARLLTLI